MIYYHKSLLLPSVYFPLDYAEKGRIAEHFAKYWNEFYNSIGMLHKKQHPYE